MRVLLIGRSHARETERTLDRLLRRDGHDVVFIDDRRLRQLAGRRAMNLWLRLRAAAHRPDRVIVAKPLDVYPDVLGRLRERAPITMWYRDIRVPPDPNIVARAREVSVLFLTPGGQAAEFEALGVARAEWLPDAADPERDHPAEPVEEWRCDVAFIGNGYDAARAAFLARLARRFRVRVWGSGWERWGAEVGWMGAPVYGGDFARVCASAAVVLGIEPSYQAEARVWGYHSNRTFKVLASAGFYLAPAAPGMRSLLRDGGHCVFYDDEADAEARIEEYLGRPDDRERIRRAGHDFVLAHHTYAHRLENLLTGAPFRNPLEGAAAQTSRTEER